MLNVFKLISICILFFTLGFVSRVETISAPLLDETFSFIAADVGVPVRLLRAICWVESKHTPYAYSQGDGRGSNHAFGMCQVLHSTARGFGFKDDNCYRNFSNSNDRSYNDCKLFGIYTNVFYGAQYLKEKLDQYGGNWEKATAAYNTGSVIICKTGYLRRAKDGSIISKCKIGDLANRDYVNKVNRALKEHR